MSLEPGEVKTNMTSMMQKYDSFVTAEQCVKGALRDIGHEQFSNGATSHEFIGFLSKQVSKYAAYALPMIADGVDRDRVRSS